MALVVLKIWYRRGRSWRPRRDALIGGDRLRSANWLVAACLFLGRTYGRAVRDRDAERGVAVQYGDADLKLCDLAIEVPCHEAPARQFHAVRRRFDAALSVISALSSP